MYRVNCDDWDRKKTYLIRSLFKDLPLLSPVYESRESSCSPSGTTSRPSSPLPPLIIEKMKNPHDEPPEFYNELERKMKKVYRKLLYNEDSISVDSLLARYSGNIPYEANYVQIDEVTLSDNNGTDDDNNFITAIETYNISKNATSVQIQSKESNTVTSSNVSNSDNSVAIENDDINNAGSCEAATTSTSDDTLANTQITTKATVHISPLQADEDTNIELVTVSTVYEGEEIPLSPLLKCHSLVRRKTQAIETEIEIAANSNDRYEDDKENSEQDEVSQNKSLEELEEENREEEYEVSQENTEENISDDTVETMRKQRTVYSLSVGSVQERGDDYFDTTVDKNNDFIRHTSYEIHSDSQNSLQGAIIDSNTEAFPDDYFSNLLNAPSPRLKGKARNRCSKRLIDDFNRNNLEFVTKRLKAKDTGVQATLFSDEHESSDWDYLKANFFVGVPKVYKLCICKNHFCREE